MSRSPNPWQWCAARYLVQRSVPYSACYLARPGGALLAALTAVIMLPLLRVFHPPGVALAMCPALLHSGTWFAILVVLPFTLAAVISCGAEPLGQQLAAIPRPFLVRVSGSLNRSPVPSRLLWSSEIGGFDPRPLSGILTTIFAPQRCSR
jgi:hypothetical protein